MVAIKEERMTSHMVARSNATRLLAMAVDGGLLVPAITIYATIKIV